MFTLDDLIENFSRKIEQLIAESTGYILVLAILTGAVSAIINFILRGLLVQLGIQYFKNRQDSWRWIGTKIIMSMSWLESDRCAFYSIRNGNHFLEQDEYEHKKQILKKTTNPNIDSSLVFLSDTYKMISNDVSKSHWRGTTPLPSELDLYRFRELLKIAAEITPVKLILRADLPEHSSLRNAFIEYGIEGAILTRIESADGKKLYGFVVHTYSDVRIMPRNIVVKYEEHLKDLRNSIRFDYEEILNLSPSAILKNKYSIWRKKIYAIIKKFSFRGISYFGNRGAKRD